MKRDVPYRFVHDYRTLPLPGRELEIVLDRLYAGEIHRKKPPIQVVFCSDKVIHRLNRIWRKKDRPTDVLSFNFDEPDLLGEIYISLQRAKVQGKRYGLGYTGELKRLLTHGFFHLLGYDHENIKERLVMEKMERKYS